MPSNVFYVVARNQETRGDVTWAGRESLLEKRAVAIDVNLD